MWAYTYQGVEKKSCLGLQLSSFILLVSYTTKKLKNKAIFILKQYWMYCYVVLSNVIYSIYSKQDSKIPPL